MKSHRLTRCLMVVTLVAMVGANAMVQSPFFWDDFDRESLWEGTEIQYRDEPDANFTIEGGSVILQPLADNFPGIWADTVPYADVSLRAQVRFLDVESCAINPWIGLYFREIAGNGSDDSYWGGPATDGLIYIGESVQGGIDIRNSKS